MTSYFKSFDASLMKGFSQSFGKARNSVESLCGLAVPAYTEFRYSGIHVPPPPFLNQPYPKSQLVHVVRAGCSDWPVDDKALFYDSELSGYSIYKRSSQSVAADSGRELTIAVSQDESTWVDVNNVARTEWNWLKGDDGVDGFFYRTERFLGQNRRARVDHPSKPECQPGTCHAAHSYTDFFPCHRRKRNAVFPGDWPRITFSGLSPGMAATVNSSQLGGSVTVYDGWALKGNFGAGWPDIGYGQVFVLFLANANDHYLGAAGTSTGTMVAVSATTPGGTLFSGQAVWILPSTLSRNMDTGGFSSSDFYRLPIVPTIPVPGFESAEFTIDY